MSPIWISFRSSLEIGLTGFLRGVKYHALNTLWKTAYAEYQKLRDEAQELVIAESNLSSLFESEREEQSRQKEKEH